MDKTIYTIGHSTHPIEHFIGLLHRHHINAVADVRSRPYSRMNPQYNREALKESLSQENIKYVFLGKELGARSEDKNCYHHGQVQYDRLAQTALYKQGIDRVIEGANKLQIALMCAEKEPLDCHRTILVARSLFERGVLVRHILASGEIENHQETLDRLIARLRVPGEDMFRLHDSVIADAYAQQGSVIAYREDQSESQDTHFSSRAAE